MFYFPLTALALLVLVAVGVLLVVFLEVRAFRYAFERMGIHRGGAYLVLIGSLLGSAINIPVGSVPSGGALHQGVIQSSGLPWVIPHGTPGVTIIAVNVGGAVIPVLVSLYLILRGRGLLSILIALVGVTLLVHLFAHPVRGVGIAVPTFIPPLGAAALALLLARGAEAPRVAYVSGTLGTLIGADLLNLGRVSGLGAPVASIGGAGTFDGVFITGVVAALLAALVRPRRVPPQPLFHEPIGRI